MNYEARIAENIRQLDMDRPGTVLVSIAAIGYRTLIDERETSGNPLLFMACDVELEVDFLRPGETWEVIGHYG